MYGVRWIAEWCMTDKTKQYNVNASMMMAGSPKWSSNILLMVQEIVCSLICS